MNELEQREHREHEVHHGHHHPVRIHIDRKEYSAPKNPMTGAELRTLAGVPLDYDLWEEVTGPHEDAKVSDAKEVHLREDMHFYSCRQTINPGATDATS